MRQKKKIHKKIQGQTKSANSGQMKSALTLTIACAGLYRGSP
jgi:hypothetical protein